MTISSFSVFVPSQILTPLQKSLRKHQNHVPEKCKHINMSEHRFFVETHSSKVDLIWHLRPIRKGQNDRILIFFLSCFHQKLDFDLVFTIGIQRFHETHTFSFGAVWMCFLEGSIRGRSGGDPGGIRGSIPIRQLSFAPQRVYIEIGS